MRDVRSLSGSSAHIQRLITADTRRLGRAVREVRSPGRNVAQLFCRLCAAYEAHAVGLWVLECGPLAEAELACIARAVLTARGTVRPLHAMLSMNVAPRLLRIRACAGAVPFSTICAAMNGGIAVTTLLPALQCVAQPRQKRHLDLALRVIGSVCATAAVRVQSRMCNNYRVRGRSGKR